MKLESSGLANEPSAASGAVKAGIAWGGVLFSKAGIHTWSDVAAVMAAVYTALLIVAWVWRAIRRWRAGKAVIPDTDRGEL